MSKLEPRNWTEKELAILQGSLPHGEAADELGVTYATVQGWRRRRNRQRPELSTSDYHEDKARAATKLDAHDFAALSKKYKAALHEASVVARLVEDIKEVAPKSYETAPPVVAVRRSSGSPQSAVLELSDTHIGAVITPDQTLGFGRYDFPTFLARLKYVEESVVSILRDHTNTQIEELVVAVLGDMLHGKLLHSAEASQRNTLFTQFYAGGHALAQFLRNLASHVPKLRVKTVVGNHSRWDSQKTMPCDNRFSNLDMFLYALVEALTKDVPNIEWDLNQQPFAEFSVQGFVFHASHGDHLRGGDKALGIPNHAVGRQVSVTTQLYEKHGRVAPHYYLVGHLHRDIKLPIAKGSVLINGGFTGLDGFGLSNAFNPVDPSQRFFLVHPRYGKTAEYELSLKHAELRPEPPYNVPTNFQVE